MRQREKHFRSREKVLGQFFTPPRVADFMVEFASLHLDRRRRGCDPACGSGVFLASMLKHGFEEVVGVDVDERCVASIPDEVREAAKVIVGDALRRAPTLTEGPLLPEGHFDLVIGNPPFSAKYGRVRDRSLLASYRLGAGLRSQAVEVLFIERFIQLARPGGVIAIILPDGVFLNLNHRRVREFILERCRVLAVISLPRAIFNGTRSTTSKTSILFALKGGPHAGEVFMAEVERVQDLERLLDLYKTRASDERAFWTEITAESLHPRSYRPLELPEFRFPVRKLGELIEEMFCGQTEYGEKRRFSESGIRFISAKVVTPLGLDFSRENRRFVEPGSPMDKERAHVRVGDVLFVRVGVGCIGRAAVVIDDEDLGVADDWIYVIRVRRGLVSPYYLALFLQTELGRKQIDRAKRGVGTVTIPQRLLKELLVPVPPREFQEGLEADYVRMVKLMRAGRYREAEAIFRALLSRIEAEVVAPSS